MWALSSSDLFLMTNVAEFTYPEQLENKKQFYNQGHYYNYNPSHMTSSYNQGFDNQWQNQPASYSDNSNNFRGPSYQDFQNLYSMMGRILQSQIKLYHKPNTQKH